MSNPEITNYDIGDLVLENGEYDDIRLYAPAPTTYVKGQSLAFDAPNGNWKITQSGTADVANAKALLAAETIYAGPGTETKTVRAVIGGKVDASKIVFDGSDTIDTIPAGAADSFGLQLRSYGIIAKELSEQNLLDNQ